MQPCVLSVGSVPTASPLPPAGSGENRNVRRTLWIWKTILMTFWEVTNTICHQNNDTKLNLQALMGTNSNGGSQNMGRVTIASPSATGLGGSGELSLGPTNMMTEDGASSVHRCF